MAATSPLRLAASMPSSIPCTWSTLIGFVPCARPCATEDAYGRTGEAPSRSFSPDLQGASRNTTVPDESLHEYIRACAAPSGAPHASGTSTSQRRFAARDGACCLHTARGKSTAVSLAILIASRPQEVEVAAEIRLRNVLGVQPCIAARRHGWGRQLGATHRELLFADQELQAVLLDRKPHAIARLDHA